MPYKNIIFIPVMALKWFLQTNDLQHEYELMHRSSWYITYTYISMQFQIVSIQISLATLFFSPFRIFHRHNDKQQQKKN